MSAPDPRSVRIGNVEREQAVQALGDHFAQGRLAPHEFEERTTAAYAARTAADLEMLFGDLPHAPRHPSAHPGVTAAFPHPPEQSFGRAPQPYGTAQPHGTAQSHGTAQPHGGPHPVHSPGGPYPVGPDPQAPYGREPGTGVPYSDRSKLVAGLLQVLLPFGIGRFYSGQIGMGVAQLVLSLFFVGMLWAFIDGIIILAGRPTDQYGRPLHP